MKLYELYMAIEKANATVKATIRGHETIFGIPDGSLRILKTKKRAYFLFINILPANSSRGKPL